VDVCEYQQPAVDDSRRLKKYFVIGALELLGIQLFVPFFKN
jgi:hypothetical protein